MSLDLRKLQGLRPCGAGRWRAACPACREMERDTAGDNLSIWADGRFHCWAHPKDKEHRQRIFALAGDRERRPLEVIPRGTPRPRRAGPETVGTGLSDSFTSADSASPSRAPSNSYNTDFPHSSLDYRTPQQYEDQRAAMTQPTNAAH